MPAQIIVGFDGSEISRATLACAVRRMRPDDRLTVAHALAVPDALLESPYFDRALERAREHGRRVLDEAKGALPADLAANTRLIEGPPAQALVELARELDADEIAVGSRGFGAFRTTALGSTSHALLHETDRPLLVITRRAVEPELRRAAAGSARDEKPTIVVGYDGSVNSRAALEFALRRTESSGGQAVAVCAFYAPSDWLGAPYYQQSLDEHRQRAHELTRQIENLPGVETDIVEGPVVDALIRTAQARDASEIVVGARGLGRFRAALGSVSYSLLHEADRALVIVPSVRD